MTKSYSAEILEAQQRTIRFGLTCPEISSTCERLLTPERHEQFPYAVRDAVGDLGLEAVVAQCLSLHWRLKEPLEEFFGVPILYTIGYVHTPPSYMFRQSESDLLRLLQTGIQGPQLNIHAWLTLPSAEIIDLSLPTSFAVVNKMKDGLGGVIAAHADELNHGLRYHPMLLGEDYLRRIGALVEFNTYGI
ncbi:hypothetical protein [Chromobacterium rhizoryzae]|uniref:hypothetical protein n=1 Tax=Chromobacterium rhizoryzae TaxID=1778675 RepID=UPI001D08EF7D|nr:hypothetical protein [Chromobacterium rhizoryzae]